ncbi:hypothetical protein GGX14DRAFT_652674 [Mycena pura]|uniref:Uncharacterized protein n=1 Tax=Mycena pura TaxID=153505 RepID=A0AAD6V5N2_9AGAR|nr:hypothetical protein GGX14DRAFT_652674 [Mycena pura]
MRHTLPATAPAPAPAYAHTPVINIDDSDSESDAAVADTDASPTAAPKADFIDADEVAVSLTALQESLEPEDPAPCGFPSRLFNMETSGVDLAASPYFRDLLSNTPIEETAIPATVRYGFLYGSDADLRYTSFAAEIRLLQTECPAECTIYARSTPPDTSAFDLFDLAVIDTATNTPALVLAASSPSTALLCNAVDAALTLREGDAVTARAMFERLFVTLRTREEGAMFFFCLERLANLDHGDRHITLTWAAVCLGSALSSKDKLELSTTKSAEIFWPNAAAEGDAATAMGRRVSRESPSSKAHQWRADCMTKTVAIHLTRGESAPVRELIEAAQPLLEAQSKYVNIFASHATRRARWPRPRSPCTIRRTHATRHTRSPRTRTPRAQPAARAGLARNPPHARLACTQPAARARLTRTRNPPHALASHARDPLHMLASHATCCAGSRTQPAARAGLIRAGLARAGLAQPTARTQAAACAGLARTRPAARTGLARARLARNPPRALASPALASHNPPHARSPPHALASHTHASRATRRTHASRRMRWPRTHATRDRHRLLQQDGRWCESGASAPMRARASSPARASKPVGLQRDRRRLLQQDGRCVRAACAPAPCPPHTWAPCPRPVRRVRACAVRRMRARCPPCACGRCSATRVGTLAAACPPRACVAYVRARACRVPSAGRVRVLSVTCAHALSVACVRTLSAAHVRVLSVACLCVGALLRHARGHPRAPARFSPRAPGPPRALSVRMGALSAVRVRVLSIACAWAPRPRTHLRASRRARPVRRAHARSWVRCPPCARTPPSAPAWAPCPRPVRRMRARSSVPCAVRRVRGRAVRRARGPVRAGAHVPVLVCMPVLGAGACVGVQAHTFRDARRRAL